MSETETVVQEVELKSAVVQDQSTSIVAAPTPFSLMQLAIEKNLDTERISQILDLQDRVEKKRQLEAYNAAMNRCQKEMPIVVRDATNKSTGSKYARLEAVANRIKPIYAEEGFSLEFGEGKSDLPNHRRIVCEITHIDGFSKEKYLDSPIDDKGAKGGENKTQIQGLGSMVSYLRRYLTLMIFNITVADEDNDGNDEFALLTEEQIKILRDKMADLEKAGCSVREFQFIDWLAKEQRSDAKTFDEIQQKVFPKAIAALDKKMRDALAKAGPI